MVRSGDEHVAEPGERGVVGDEPGEAGLLAAGAVEAEHEGVLDRPRHHLVGPAGRPVAFRAHPLVYALDVHQRGVIARPVAVRSLPSHERPPSAVPPPAGGITGSPGGGPAEISPSSAPVSRWPATRSPSTSSLASRSAAKSVSGAGRKSRPASAATSPRNARRNASFSMVPCQLVPHTAPLRRPSRNGSARSEEHTSELQSRRDLVCRLLLEKKKKNEFIYIIKKKKQYKQ